MAENLLEVKHLKKYFDITHGFSFGKEKRYLRAVDDVSFTVKKGETLGLVGGAAAGNPRPGTASYVCWIPRRERSCSRGRIFQR